MIHFPSFLTNCGRRNVGLFGSFQAAQSRTAGSVWPPFPTYWPLYRAAAAYAKSRRYA